MQHIPFVIKVLCRGTAKQAHPRRELARYEWSDEEGAWVRIDRADSGKDWTGRRTAEGKIEVRPRPVFQCQCGNRPVYTHDQLQAKIEQAAGEGKHLTI